MTRDEKSERTTLETRRYVTGRITTATDSWTGPTRMSQTRTGTVKTRVLTVMTRTQP